MKLESILRDLPQAPIDMQMQSDVLYVFAEALVGGDLMTVD
jgi:hypothetical protein